MSNPIFATDTIPPLNAIKEEHFIPALKEAIERTKEKFKHIRDNQDAPTFANTVAPFDTLYEETDRIAYLFWHFYLNIRSEAIQNMEGEFETLCNELYSEISQDPVIGERFKKVYDSKASLNLDDADSWFLETLKSTFEGTGAMLPVKGQKRINEIDKKLIPLCAQHSKNLHEGQKQQRFLISDERFLAGVPDDKKAAFAEAAKEAGHSGKWLFTPERLLVDELLGVAENRDFRQQIHEAMDRVGKVAPHDNTDVIRKIHALRDERSKLLGYAHYGDYSLSGTMAGSVQNVVDLLDQSSKALLEAFEEDMDTLQTWVTQQGGPSMEPWDVQYYTALYKKEVLGYDEAELTDYLEINDVMDGWLEHASKHMNMTFTPSTAYPSWDSEVLVYDVEDHDTGEASILYVDLYARPESKEGGAWMSEIQKLNSDSTKPQIIIMNMNLVKADGETTVLVSPPQLETLYHEGGHALNGLKGTQSKYLTRMGTGNGADYVEIHSMMSENWAFHPDVILGYAKHHKTQAPLDKALLDAKEKSEGFMASWDMLRLVQNARRDINFHSLGASEYKDDADVEAASKLPSSLSDHVRPYPLTRFSHLFSGADSQYAAGYYGYLWAEVKANQAFSLFAENGVYNAQALKKAQDFFALGASKEPNKAFDQSFDLTGLDVNPFLKKYGITPPPARQSTPVKKQGKPDTKGPKPS